MNWLTERRNYLRYRALSEDAWLQTLLDSVGGRSRVPMPRFPAADIQRSFVGTADQDAIREAWRFYSLMTDRWKKYGLRIGGRSHVLDFGCGWGRYARMFLRNVPASHIYCADTSDWSLDVCRDTGVPGQMVRLEPMPPSPLPPAQFDVAFAYSVFSHLSPKSHLAWRTELARVMKPNGILFATTQARWFFDECRQSREHPDQISDKWHEELAKCFVDYEASVSEYEAGEFLFAADKPTAPPTTTQISQRLGPELYGQAVVPSGYFESQWSEAGFELLEFVADRSLCEQAIAILRKR